ncbi:MAG: adenosine kinase [Rhodospirillaceae bacterium]|jgi:sugar/nucleoside kinase (ribokinase family)|nr:adenosine kinase [Rhodospirillaceae bacterium]MBT6139334.1 adenosine kinase [Rhodospirillaceae bacterium]
MADKTPYQSADKSIDVTALGNAIVDVIARSDDGFLGEHGIEKGAMNLIDAERAEFLYDHMGPGLEMSGGSAGNTITGVAQLGSSGAYIGKVHDDTLGKVFRHDIQASGVRFDTVAASDGPPTARCLIMVTPDAQRSMNTYLGACVDLGPEDVDGDVIAASKVVYLEGYLWDPPRAKEAFTKAASIAHATGGKVSLTLSDSFCVDRHRVEFRELVKHHVDILFANEDELKSLFEVSSFDEAMQQLRWECDVAAVTRGDRGSVVMVKDEVHFHDAEAAEKVIDTTGAGDLYAAGFLHAYCQDLDPALWGRYGGIAAAEVISHYGARPETDLKTLVAEKLG